MIPLSRTKHKVWITRNGMVEGAGGEKWRGMIPLCSLKRDYCVEHFLLLCYYRLATQFFSTRRIDFLVCINFSTYLGNRKMQSVFYSRSYMDDH